jgi:hypothetical protein
MITGSVENLLRRFSFMGEGFAGFAWSSVNTQLVVAAVAESAEGVAVDAESSSSFAGIYYSTDAGQMWHVATVTDGPGKIIQSAQGTPAGYPGNSATSVAWNPVRKRFYAAVRYHGYYESVDGVTWMRLDSQPGVNLLNLFPAKCPANPNMAPSSACPIFRGTITAQPATGDLFAITVDNSGIDQGLWRDVCSATSNGCASSTVNFSQQIADASIEAGGNGVIPQGDYALSLAAVPSKDNTQDTLLFVGTQDIFRCSLANNCAWRNTTNTNGCDAAQVAPSQHAFDYTVGASGLIYFGNDGGLWRTTDDVDQQQPPCSPDDATHFQNLNGGLGSLAEVGSFSVHPQNPNVLMAAMGPFGTAAPGVGGNAWAQILDGEGDANAIDPENPQNWYATSAAHVSINLCPAGTACDKAGFGSPVIGNAQVENDGHGLTGTAAWILDPQNTANIIIGTCRVWRGAANGSGWTASNIMSPMLDMDQQPACNGNAQIRSLAASGGTGATESIYAGMAGWADGGATVAGHVYKASVNSTSGTAPAWSDLSMSTVTNNPQNHFNASGFDVSSIYVDPHDSTGNTVYVTLQGFVPVGTNSSGVYRSPDGGATWRTITSNLPNAPANSILVDPDDANTVYVAMDTGVYVTRNIGLCEDTTQSCWSSFGTGLPFAPVTQLKTSQSEATSQLFASTYGRGLWQIPLVTAGAGQTMASLSPSSIVFASQQENTASGSQTVTVTNKGTAALTITSIVASQNFSQSNNCTQSLAPEGTCSIQVSFTPEQTGALNGTLTVFGNIPTGQLLATLSGTGLAAGNIVLLPRSANFGNALVGTTTGAQNITISNTGETSVNLQTPKTTGDFKISANTCGTSLAPNFGCTVSVTFAPTASGAQSGVFSITDDEGTQTVQLSGTGQAPATAVLSKASLDFSTPPVTVGTKSGPLEVELTNNGDVSLSDIAISVSGDFTAGKCGPFLIGHSTCAISVVFVPTQAGKESGSLLVHTALGEQNVSLSGTGLTPAGISLLPASVNFGSQAVGTTSNPQKVTLTNNGEFELTGLTFAVSGDYAISANSCSSTGTVDVGASCSADIAFTPSQAGVRNGSLMVNGANLATPLNVPLSGTGADFQLMVDGSSSAVIVSGQTATYAVQVIPVSGPSGMLTMGCSGVPTNATCTLNPQTLPIVSGTTGYATVTVATGVSSTTSAFAPLAGRWQGMGIAVAASFPCILLGIRWRTSRIMFRALLVCVASVSLWALTSCSTNASGGSSLFPGEDTTQNPTPSGVYTINITASIPGLQRSVPVTLTVQ